MMSKKIITIVIMLIMLTAPALKVFGMTEISVELPFVVENINGTVVIEAVDDAPLPEVTEFKDVAEGVFVFSYTQPDTHHYRIHQQMPANSDDVIYDSTVYNVAVYVLSDDDGALYAVYAISIDGFAEKQESVSFENRIPTGETDPPVQTGDNSHLWIWLAVSLSSLAGILILLFIMRRKKER